MYDVFKCLLGLNVVLKFVFKVYVDRKWLTELAWQDKQLIMIIYRVQCNYNGG